MAQPKNVLLDTHVLLWMIAEPHKVGRKTRTLLESAEVQLRLSTASLFEIAVKYSLKKLPLPEPPAAYLPRYLDQMGIVDLAVDRYHAFRVTQLPWHHRDPFDRLILAQALVEKFPLVTADEQLMDYKVTIVDARV